MVKTIVCKTCRFRFGSRPLLFLAILFALAGMATLACGVKAGDNRPARPQGQSEEFHRTPVTAFEQYRVDVAKDEQGACTTTEADIQAVKGQRVRLAVQLKTEGISQGATGSIEVVGDRDSVTYSIPGLQISASGGAFSTGVTSIELDLEAGTRNSYDFNVANVGTFDIMCDDAKIGSFTASESSG